MGHAEHVQGGKDQTPNAEEDQGRSINGHFAVNGLAGFIVAHAHADWRTAFKHTEQSNPSVFTGSSQRSLVVIIGVENHVHFFLGG